MKRISFIAIMLLGGMCIYAQNSNSGIKYSKTSQEDKLILYNTKQQGPHEIPVPRFSLKSGNGKFIMAIGGFIQPVVGMDIGNTLNGNMYFRPSSIVNVPAITGQKSEFFINPLNSTVDLQVVGFPGTKNEFTGYVKFDFKGGTGGMLLKMSALYIKYRGFLAGYNYSLTTDVYSLPTTISWSGVTGNDWRCSYQVSYNSRSYKGFAFGVAIEQPCFNDGTGVYEGKDYPDFDDHEVIGKATQAIPDIPFYIQYGWKKHSHVRLTGIVRNFSYVDKLEDKTRITTGYGMQLSTALRIAKPLTFLGQAVYGKGIGNYINGMQYYPVSYLPDDANPGKVKSTTMMGWFAGLRCFVSPKVFLNGTFGQTRMYGVGSYWDKYKYGLDARFSVFCNITPYVQTGIEYLWARQVRFTHEAANVNRIQTMVKVSL